MDNTTNKTEFNYTSTQIALIQRLCDHYRAMPETLTVSDRFCSFPLNKNEEKDLDVLVQQGVVDMMKGEGIINVDFFRLSDNSAELIKKLKSEGKLYFG